jgi:tetratricopeptide (TPR) repeat protein
MKTKQLLFYSVTGIGIPVLLVLCLELILRLCNVGYDPHFFLHVKNNGKMYCVDNPAFGCRFFPPTLVRASEKIQFPVSKSTNKCRIFILGSSAAQGEPAPAFGFSRQLGVLLQGRYKNVQCEVINTGVTAINSHVVVPIARECARLSPDVVIVYTGNNEVIGPFGPGTVFSGFSKLLLIRLRIFLSSTRLGQLASAVSSSLAKSNGVPTGWGGMKMFLKHKIRHDDPRLAGVYTHYRENLREICKAARRSSVRVVLCTVASNLKDCPPFFSMHGSYCSTDSIKKCDSLFNYAVILQKQNDFSDALTEFQKAAVVDSTYAILQFKIAQCQSALGQHDQARGHYIAARDYDALRFRADTRLNQIVRDVANEFKDCAVLFDSEKSLTANTECGVSGEEQFLEHVHFNVHGNYQFAGSLLPVIDSLINKPEAIRTALSETECRKRLAFTQWEESQIDREVYKRLTRPPFADLDDNQVRAGELKRKIEMGRDGRADSSDKNINGYRYALSKDSTDVYVLGLFGNYLLRNAENAVLAEGVFRKLIQLMPQNEFAHSSLAISLEQQGKLTEAIEYYCEVIRINPLYFDAYIKIADALIHVSRLDEAKKYLDRVLRINPELPAALQRYAQLLIIEGKAVTDPHCFEKNEIFRMALATYYNAEGIKFQETGDIAAALKKFESAIIIYYKSSELHISFGKALEQAGRSNDAIEQFKIAVSLDSLSPKVRISLADALARQSFVDDAIKQYQAALSIDSTLVSVLNSVGVLYVNDGHYDLAIEQFMRAVHQQPEMLAVHNNIITAYTYLNKKAEAVVIFEQLLKTYPQSAELHYSLGKLLLERGNIPEARKHLDIAAQLRPDLMQN